MSSSDEIQSDNGPATPNSDAPAQPPTKPSKPPGRPLNTSREIAVALAIMAFLFVVQLSTEHTRLVEGSKTHAFAFFQGLLSDTTEKRLPVVVLDIGDVKVGTNGVTDRRKLKDIVDALRQAGATAVGVDVDMSPNKSGFMDRDADPDLFEHWRQVSTEMPVFVGVYRARDLTPERWLGLGEFESLGAFLGTAKTPDGDRVTRMQSHYLAPNAEGEGLPTLGYALADSYLKRQGARGPEVSWYMSPFIEPVDESEEGRLVNFSKVGQFQRERTLDVSPEAIAGPDARDYRQRVVLLGDIEPEDLRRDSFFAPGYDRLPGVLYHASAVWTFAFEPVYEFNWWTRTVLDLMLGSLFIAAVWARSRFKRTAQHRGGSLLRFMEQYALVAGFLLLVSIAFVAMRFFQIMWLDAIVVAFALVIHYALPQQVKEVFPSLFSEEEDGHE
ncbi:CHASE2 domain-containing protein [Paraburkholderia youngii]|uniref:CHASE2 domain-containing protein n=1 Tax=Paraburkholderia youngii TaxID=2782701 RepID=UPI003D1EB80E